MCKKLRKLGVDALALESYENYEAAKEMGEKDGRMILTKSINHAVHLKRTVIRDHVLYITKENLDEQVNGEIFRFRRLLTLGSRAKI